MGGVLGSLPPVDVGLLSEPVSDYPQQPLRFTAYVEPERLSGRISSGPAAPNRPLSRTELCASVPQWSRQSFWQVLSNSVFDRMAGRAETSKRTLGRLENELPGVPK